MHDLNFSLRLLFVVNNVVEGCPDDNITQQFASFVKRFDGNTFVVAAVGSVQYYAYFQPVEGGFFGMIAAFNGCRATNVHKLSDTFDAVVRQMADDGLFLRINDRGNLERITTLPFACEADCNETYARLKEAIFDSRLCFEECEFAVLNPAPGLQSAGIHTSSTDVYRYVDQGKFVALKAAGSVGIVRQTVMSLRSRLDSRQAEIDQLQMELRQEKSAKRNYYLVSVLFAVLAVVGAFLFMSNENLSEVRRELNQTHSIVCSLEDSVARLRLSRFQLSQRCYNLQDDSAKLRDLISIITDNSTSLFTIKSIAVHRGKGIFFTYNAPDACVVNLEILFIDAKGNLIRRESCNSIALQAGSDVCQIDIANMPSAAYILVRDFYGVIAVIDY